MHTALVNFQDERGGAVLCTHVQNHIASEILAKIAKGQKTFTGDVYTADSMLFVTEKREAKEPDQAPHDFKKDVYNREPKKSGNSPFQHTMADVRRQDFAAERQSKIAARLDSILADTVANYLADGGPESEGKVLGFQVFAALTGTQANEASACLDLVDAGFSTKSVRAINKASKLIHTVMTRLQNQ